MSNLIAVFSIVVFSLPFSASAENILYLKELPSGSNFTIKKTKVITYEDDDGNEHRHVVGKDRDRKKYIAEKIIVDNNFIKIIGSENKVCKFAIDDLLPIQLKRENCCGQPFPERDEARKEIIDTFKNATDYKIYCLISGDEVLTYTFNGHTVVKGKPSSVHDERIINIQRLETKPEEPTTPNQFNDFMKSVSDSFLKSLVN